MQPRAMLSLPKPTGNVQSPVHCAAPTCQVSAVAQFAPAITGGGPPRLLKAPVGWSHMDLKNSGRTVFFCSDHRGGVS
jgi:hypothetical protein